MTPKPQYHLQQHITNLSDIKELAAWPGVWVMRGGSSVRGHNLYGFDIAHNQLLWTLTDIAPPEGLGWTYKRIPFLAQIGNLAVVATYVGRNREAVWLLALEPRTGDLVWRKPLMWAHRTSSSNKLFDSSYIGIVNAGAHLLAMENRAAQGEEPFLLWLDPATGETVHECPACVTKERALVADRYLYFSGERRNQSGLYRIPAAPGAMAAERLLEGQLSSFAITAGNIYAIYSTTQRQDWTFACLDAQTLAPRCSYVWEWADKGYWPRLLAVDPERPECVVLDRDTRLWAWNWRTAETLWEHAFPFSTDVQALFHTPRGTLLHADQGVEGLDLVTGARSDVGLSGDRVEGAFVVGDYLFTSKRWEGSRLCTCAAMPDSATIGELTCPETKLRELLPDLLTDPRDELETAFGKALGRGSVDTLAKSVRQITRIDQTHQKVKAYLKALKAGELANGPLDFTPLAELHRGFFFYTDLFGFGPEEQFFPGVLMAGEFGGVEFYLMWDTGQVISLHHDASFSEVASDVRDAVGERVGAFEQRFVEAGSALDIAQLVRFQRAFANVKDTGDLARLDRRDYLGRTAAAFGWTLKQLRQQLDKHYLPLEFLGIHDEELAVLDEMLR
ncbi:MAG: hypothetical protein JW892_01200 [Anaerolineae bacterium]|nr:hypothetical protein [Anaerolineae bacterium]